MTYMPWYYSLVSLCHVFDVLVPAAFTNNLKVRGVCWEVIGVGGILHGTELPESTRVPNSVVAMSCFLLVHIRKQG